MKAQIGALEVVLAAALFVALGLVFSYHFLIPKVVRIEMPVERVREVSRVEAEKIVEPVKAELQQSIAHVTQVLIPELQARIQAEIKELRNQTYTAVQQNFTLVQERLDQLRGFLERLNSSLIQLNTSLSQLRSHTNESVQNLYSWIRYLNSTLANLRGWVRAINSSVAEQGVRLEKLEAGMEDLESRVSNLEAGLSQMRLELGMLSSWLAQNATRIQDLESKLEHIQTYAFVGVYQWRISGTAPETPYAPELNFELPAKCKVLVMGLLESASPYYVIDGRWYYSGLLIDDTFMKVYCYEFGCYDYTVFWMGELDKGRHSAQVRWTGYGKSYHLGVTAFCPPPG